MKPEPSGPTQAVLFEVPAPKAPEPAKPVQKPLVRDAKGKRMARRFVQFERDLVYEAICKLHERYVAKGIYYHPHGDKLHRIENQLDSIVTACDAMLEQEGEDFESGPGRPLCANEKKSRLTTPESDYTCGHTHCMQCGGHGTYSGKDAAGEHIFTLDCAGKCTGVSTEEPDEDEEQEATA